MPYSTLLVLALSVAAPCDLASQAEIEKLLDAPIVAVPATEIGEETAPACLWATGQRQNEVKLTIWSEEELPVLNMLDAGTVGTFPSEPNAARLSSV